MNIEKKENIDPDDLFEFVSEIEADLSDDEFQEAVRNWLFITTWLNQLTNREFRNPDDVLSLFLDLCRIPAPVNPAGRRKKEPMRIN